jgi:hypothetical protein
MYVDYSNYVYFGHLCEVPQDVLNNLQEYYQHLQNVEADQKHSRYKQWYAQDTQVQKKNLEISWSYWKDNNMLDITKNFFSTYVDNIVKFRFSYLIKDSMVEYHSKHSLPRIHIPLNDADSKFLIKDNDGNEHVYDLTYGHAHFVNVTYPHKVVATKDVDRMNSFFCFTNFVDKNIEQRFLK